MNGYQPILDLYREIGRSQDGGAVVAALCMTFVTVDTMAWLNLPVGRSSVKRDDFCQWVDAYLKAAEGELYQYAALDVYAARCAMLHHYGAEADLHRGAAPPRRFGYVDTGSHQVGDSDLVLISVATLVRDLGRALGRFLQHCQDDSETKARVDSRVGQLATTCAIQHSTAA